MSNDGLASCNDARNESPASNGGNLVALSAGDMNCNNITASNDSNESCNDPTAVNGKNVSASNAAYTNRDNITASNDGLDATVMNDSDESCNDPTALNGKGSENDSGDIEVPSWMLPDDSTLDDYPESHIPDPEANGNDDIDVIILEQDGEGHVHMHAASDDDVGMERNGVKGDAFHGIDGYKKTLKKKHGMYDTFSGMLWDAMFMMVDKDAMERERKKLSDSLFNNEESSCYNDREKSDKEAKQRLYCAGSKVLDDVPRVIPPPDELLPRIKKVVDMCANTKDAKTGDVLFSKKTRKYHAQLWKHLEKGCYSDTPGFNYYYFITTSRGKQQLMCVRGTSPLEGFHAHLRCIFPGFHTAPLLAAVCLKTHK